VSNFLGSVHLSLRISNIAEILQKMDEDAKNKNNLNFQDYLDELDIYLKAIKNGLSGQR
jgi:ABC-type Zn uptake system ZnuABC Zn-binding protein ZnuA